MRNLLNKQLKNEKGLTLIELLAVIVILAIVAAIAIPSIGTIIDNSKSKAILSDATQLISSAKTEMADGSCAEDTTEGAETGNNTCDATVLKTLIDGGKENNAIVGTDKVVKVGTEYSIYYAKFADLNDKYSAKLVSGKKKGEITATTKIKATDLAKAMGK